VSVVKRRLIVMTAAGLALGVATQAAGSQATQPAKAQHGAAQGDRPSLAVLERPTRHFDKSVRIAHRRAKRAEARAARRSGAPQGGVPSPESLGVSTATLDSIAACESGGNPTAVSPDGTYRGKYQFDYGTWASVGGSGDPAAAPEAEQDYRAAVLYSRAGSSPWPICGS
jgi:soluble lytic murein transglycosylase-like protein